VIGFVAGIVVGGFVPAFGARSIEVLPAAATTSAGDATATTLMPDVRGLSDLQARQVLADMGLGQVPLKFTKTPNISPEGFIVAQSPLAGTPNPVAITLTLPESAVMPPLADQTEDEAQRTIQAMGADVTVERRFVPGKTPGLVLESRPSAKQPVSAAVVLVVSAPAQQTYLANVQHEGICSAAAGQANGVAFEHSLQCRAGAEAGTAVWLLNRRVQRLTGTLGVDDGSGPETSYAIRISADGKVLYQGTLTYGKTTGLDVSVAGVLRLELVLTRTDKGPNGGLALMGDLAVTGGEADLDSLRTR